MTSTASPIEVVWTLIALSGFAVQAAILRDALRDRKAVLVRGNRRRGLLVRGHLRSGGIFLTVHALFIFSGISAMLNPEPMRAAQTISRVLVISLFIAAAVLLVVAGILDRRDRNALRQPEVKP